MLKFKLIHYYGLFVVINTEIIQSNIHKELRLQRRLSGIYRLVSYTQAHSPQLQSGIFVFSNSNKMHISENIFKRWKNFRIISLFVYLQYRPNGQIVRLPAVSSKRLACSSTCSIVQTVVLLGPNFLHDPRKKIGEKRKKIFFFYLYYQLNRSEK